MLDHPKTNDDLIWISELTISTLFLFRDQRFRGYCILSFNAWDATNLEALTDVEYNPCADRARRPGYPRGAGL
ncbi:MAG: hypothetical protein U0694_22045 [Anaerolineae bacterium]